MQFQYQPLKLDEIRILELLPAIESAELEGRIHIETIGQHCTYEALSYCWGSTTKTEQLWIDGRTLAITAPLVSALTHLRFESQSRFLWIDQISIDQENAAEKNKHVQDLMGNIYTKATELAIWLGETDRTSDLAFDTVKRACTEMEQNGGSCTFHKGDLSLVNLRDTEEKFDFEPWIAVRNLLDRPWFTRAWVVQELCLPGSDSITVYCGKNSLPWWKLAVIDNAIARYAWHLHAHEAPSKMVEFHRAAPWTQPLEHTRQMLQVSKAEGVTHLATLLDNLWTFRDRQCLDARDKIYSIKHICRDVTAVNLRVDYGMTAACVFKDVTRSIIDNTKSLRVLGACQPAKRLSDLPSWVPDWTVGSTQRSAKQLTSMISWASAPPFEALPHMEANILPFAQPNELCIRGYRLATVIAMSMESPSASMKDVTAENMVDILASIAGMVRTEEKADSTSNISPYPSQVCRSLCVRLISEAFSLWSRELSAGSASMFEASTTDTVTDPKKHQTLASILDEAWLEAGMAPTSSAINSNALISAALTVLFGKNLLERNNQGLWTTLVLGMNSSEEPMTIHDPSKNAPVFLTNMVPSCIGRRFFRATDDDFGMGPSGTEIGDHICLFPGASTPFILRSINGTSHWTLIGECYHHNYMDGLKGRRLLDSSAPLEVFRLI